MVIAAAMTRIGKKKGHSLLLYWIRTWSVCARVCKRERQTEAERETEREKERDWWPIECLPSVRPMHGTSNVVQTLNCVQLFVIPWTAAYQTPLSFTISRSLLKFMSVESVMLSNYLILCCLFLPFPSIFPSIRGFSKWVGSSYQVGKFMHIISNPPHNPVKLFPLSLLYKGEGNGNPLQYSYPENPMDRGVWQAYNPWGHEESDMTEWLHFTYITKEEMHSKTFPSKLSIKSDSHH